MEGGAIDEEGVFAEGQYTDNPAIGLVATTDNSDQIPARILRAQRHGHNAIVVARHPDSEGVEFAGALGAVVVRPDEIGNGSELTDPESLLSTVAHVDGYPGLLYHRNAEERIDFTASNAALEQAETYTIETQAEPPVENEPDVLIGIPAYNEESTIGSIVQEAQQSADSVLVVDDGSDDETAQVAEGAGATVVNHEKNQGYGAALQTIFTQAANAQADQLVIIDGDGQHDIEDVNKLVRTQRETDAEIVIGSRFGEGGATEMPLYRRFGLGVINLLTNFSLGIFNPQRWVRDTQSGFRAYDRAAIETLAEANDIGDGMHASTDILYQGHEEGYRFEEVPITIDYSVDDTSSQNPINHGITLVMNIIKTVERKRPITALGLPGFGAVLLGMVLTLWTVSNYIETGSFPFGVALGASVATIVGFLASFTAIILHSLSLHHR